MEGEWKVNIEGDGELGEGSKQEESVFYAAVCALAAWEGRRNRVVCWVMELVLDLAMEEEAELMMMSDGGDALDFGVY
ncbi:hypothetical protein RIF29_29761 [Crotalaria pallida]|uniref:Uncharacterized protein n=1 Tax=Crotalaria pallida TaxID=3830 RepID=A0AAN9EF52_CROPI